MIHKFIKVQFELECEWTAFEPEYRIYVNDELFAERTYSLKKPHFYKEMLQIKGSLGKYIIKIEPIPPRLADFKVSNTEILFGDGIVLNELEVEII